MTDIEQVNRTLTRQIDAHDLLPKNVVHTHIDTYTYTTDVSHKTMFTEVP